MYLIFDTETTNFPSKKLDPTDSNQARVMQLAWLLLSETYEEVSCFNSLIRIPCECNISEGAQKAHGISRDDCEKYGVNAAAAISIFVDVAKSSKLVAHNIAFDSQLVDIECACAKIPSVIWTDKCYCTMNAMTDICQLPFVTRRNFGQQYKWPSLQEAHRHCFGCEFDKAHDALADVRATAKVFKWLMTEQKNI